MENQDCRLDGLMDWLYDHRESGENPLISCAPWEFEAVKQSKRKLLREKTGLDKLEAIGCPPVVRRCGIRKVDGCTVESLTMEALPRFVFPFYIVRPEKDANGKGVLYCHGHGEGGVQDCFVISDPAKYHKNIPLTMAKRGYTVYLFEPAGFGDFYIDQYQERERSGCYALSTQLLMYGMTTIGLRLYQALRVEDYMAEQGVSEFVSSGISGGGMACAFLAALDDRMKGNVICCYPNLFRDCIMAMPHCVDNFVPGIFEVGEMPEIIALAAPKPMIMSCGSRDPIFPIDASRKAVEAVRRIYRAHGIAAPVDADFFDGVHEISEGILPWIDQILGVSV